MSSAQRAAAARATLMILVAVVALCAFPAAQQKPAGAQAPQSADALLGAALHDEEIAGRLESAIAIYKRVLTMPGATREQQARAQLHIGLCHERLGNAEARKAYDAVVRSFADQTEHVTLARGRLEALAPGGTRRAATGPVLRLVYRTDDSYNYPVASPDGRYLALDPENVHEILDLQSEGKKPLLTARAGQLEPCGLTSDTIWSPDGRQLAWGCHTTESGWHIRTAGLDAPHPRVLARSTGGMRVDEVQDWSPDGRHVLILGLNKDRSTAMALASLEDGSVSILKQFGVLSTGSPRALRFSPDGRFIAYDCGKLDDLNDPDVFVVARGGGEPMPVSAKASVERLIGWAPDGSGIVYLSNHTGRQSLWLMPFVDGSPRGAPRLLKEDVGDVFTRTARITRGGAIFYSVRGTNRRTLRVATVDIATGSVLGGPSRPSPPSDETEDAPAWSPDGQTLAYISYRGSETAGSGSRMLSLVDVGTGRLRQLTMPALILGMYRLVWSTDGTAVFGNGRRPDRAAADELTLFRISVDTGDAKEVTVCRRICAVVPDGSAVFDLSRTGVTARKLNTGETQQLYVAPPKAVPIFPPRLSPDSKWLAFVETERTPNSPTALKVIPTGGGEPRTLYRAPIGGNIHVGLGWSADSKHVLFTSDRRTWQVPVDGGAPVGLEFGFSWTGDFAPHPDGRRIAFYANESEPSETWVLENVLPPASAKPGRSPRLSARR